MRIVVALGGNALLERGEAPESDIQEAHIVKAVAALAPLTHDHDLVLSHGNGPEVGLLALESARDPALSRPYPLDVLGAQTQGMIGYWLMQALQNALPERKVACLVSRTLVRADDPAFANPAKLVGPVYDEAASLRARSFPAGSMGPKIEAACRFVEATGKMAAIGRLADAKALLDRKAGAVITL